MQKKLDKHEEIRGKFYEESMRITTVGEDYRVGRIMGSMGARQIIRASGRA